MRVYLSGIHSGPDPSPGLGLARSLRQAFPSCCLVGVDYSPESTGVHSGLFDELWLQRQWQELDLAGYADRIRARLDEQETCWLSGLDVEINWLARAVGPHPRLLQPTSSCLERARKPANEAAEMLGLQAPPACAITVDGWLLHQFCRRNGWPLWVKGAYHDAKKVASWAELQRALLEQQDWEPSDLFVQTHAAGQESCVAFAAFRGRLLGCTGVEKRVLTGTGKTWGAAISIPPAEIEELLSRFVAETGWTGGGELELVTNGGRQWLIDLNPRFPAYVHGITQCGINLPGMLVAAALNREAPEHQLRACGFVRVVIEQPIDPRYPVPSVVQGQRDTSRISTKHPSLQPQLARLLQPRHQPAIEPQPYPEPQSWQATEAVARALANTPQRIEIPGVLQHRVRSIAGQLNSFENPLVRPALSIKTLPSRALGEAAAQSDWLAEVISEEELSFAVRCGFPTERLILNGPGRFAVAGRGADAMIRFHDSLDSFAADPASRYRASGVRINLPGRPSRFGVTMEHASQFTRLTALLAEQARRSTLTYGLHFHLPCEQTGIPRWNTACVSFCEWARRISRLVGVGPSILDIGGGWHPDDFDELFVQLLPRLHERVQMELPSVQALIIEPGKAVSGGAFALVSSVVEVRSLIQPESKVAVVDASIADLPLASIQPHRILCCQDSGVGSTWLGPGPDEVWGTSCMEIDILARQLSLPFELSAGDRLVFFDAGAYDASMAWEFGRGRYRDEP
jgi:diaminopimelate decarboxylase